MSLAISHAVIASEHLDKLPIPFSQLPGWEQGDVQAGFRAFLRNCRAGLPKSPGWSQETWDNICQKAEAINPEDMAAVRSFFETHFDAFAVAENQEGLFTGYYQPVAAASKKKTSDYNTPLYRKPPELFVIEDLQEFNSILAGTRIAGHIVEDSFRPYYTRAEINSGVLEGRDLEIAWLKSPADAFFIAVQGSGLLEFENGEQLSISYGGANGRPYTAIGKVLIEWGEIKKEDMSMQAIRKWLAENPSRQEELLNQNESYIFFKEIGDAPPEGGHGVGLTEKGSLAVDPHYVRLGTPLWLTTHGPDLNCLVVAQDVGSAIKGEIRGDFYWGTGDNAAENAGKMAARGTYYALEPKV